MMMIHKSLHLIFVLQIYKSAEFLEEKKVF